METSFTFILNYFSKCVIETLAVFLLYWKTLQNNRENRKKWLLLFFILFSIRSIAYFSSIPSLYIRWIILVPNIIIVFLLSRKISLYYFMIGCTPHILFIATDRFSIIFDKLFLRISFLEKFYLSAFGGMFINLLQCFLPLLFVLFLTVFINRFQQKYYQSKFSYFFVTIGIFLFIRIVDFLFELLFLESDFLIMDIHMPFFFRRFADVFGSFLGLVIIFLFGIRQIGISGKKEKEAAKLEQRRLLETENLEQIKVATDTYQKLKHDLKSHLGVVYGSLNEKNYDSAEKYIQTLYNDLNQYASVYSTENPYLNSLLSQKKDFAEKNNINFTVTIGYTGSYPIADTELCSLIGNALNNAFEACIKSNTHKEVELLITSKQKMIRIDIKNTTNGQYLLNGKELITTKNEKGHGFGIKRMRDILQRAGGFMRWKNEDKSFELEMWIPMI